MTLPENPSDGGGDNGAYFFKRKEEKYEMHLGAATFLRTEIERHLPLFEFRKGDPYTYVTTVYFDTERLEFYRQAKSFFDDNLKIRIKEYYYQNRTSSAGLSGNDPWVVFDYCFVEIKQRIRGLVVKRRFDLPKRLLGRLLRGEDLWHELVASRSGIEFTGFVDIYHDFRWILQRYKIYPKSIINYRRTVYQQDESELRITFDDELAVYEPRPRLYEETETLARSALGEPRRVFDTVIMEIKCQNGHPQWLQQLLLTHLPKRISKFTSSLNVLTQELPSPASGENLKDTHLREGHPGGDTTRISGIKL